MGRWIVILCIVLAAAGGGIWALQSKDKPAKTVKRSSGGPVVSIGGAKGGSRSSAGTSSPISRPSSSTRGLSVGGGGGGPSGDFASSPESQYEPGEVLVSNPPRGFADSVGQLGFLVTETVSLPKLSMTLYRLRTPPGMSVPEATKMLAAKYPGLTLDANHQFEAQGPRDFPRSLPRVVVGWGSANASCGKGLRLGMIDAAVDVAHPALKGQNIEFVSFHKKGRQAGPADHGTAVAGIFIGKGEWQGLLPGAALFAGNMFEVNEEGRVVGNGVGLLKSINWLAEKQVHVVNMSVAGGDNKVVRKALKMGMQNGLVIVAAAGNWGKKGNKPAFPAAYKEVMAVTALASQQQVYSHANTGPYIDFAAPGVQIYTASPGGGGKMQSGTSFAAPFISALVALENQRAGKSSAATLRDTLLKRTIDLGQKGRDQVFGSGMVNQKLGCG